MCLADIEMSIINTILFYLETKTYTLLLNSYLKKKKKSIFKEQQNLLSQIYS